MRFSQSTESAVDSLLYMGAHPRGQEFSVEDVAAAQSISPSYLAKVFQQLVKAGLLRSRRGAKGGYHLARPSREITLLEIAAVMEGVSPLYDCDAQVKRCHMGSRCLILATFREAERKMQDVLRAVTLQDLLDRLQRNRERAKWVATESPGEKVLV